ncbi:MAG: hypothetical protein F6J86_26520 [Symploca sp. SIO1B1]|nr:hypothetical protein [Symploca sp. SIO1B1]
MTITWNYRVFQEADGDYIIREVFYTEDGSIKACSAKAVEPSGRNFQELVEELKSFQEALKLPVLTLKDIPTSKLKEKPKSPSGKNISHQQLMIELGLNKC